MFIYLIRFVSVELAIYKYNVDFWWKNENGAFNGNVKIEPVDITSINMKREYEKVFENTEYSTNEKLNVSVISYLDNHKLFIFSY